MQTQITSPVAATSIKISAALKARLQALAEVRQRSPHALMVQALEEYVTREEKREAWRQEGLATWEEYQRTGLHLSHAEAAAWLAELAAGNDAEPPKCHI
ncbi:CopG family ribbon-helix-helix protein [Desulfovibrio porci]|uniref:CopG family ribbon-helix-helix protein n=1 Tax=Desulfovibrio porci TaxID=2605782 RepID=UPI003A95066B